MRHKHRKRFTNFNTGGRLHAHTHTLSHALTHTCTHTPSHIHTHKPTHAHTHTHAQCADRHSHTKIHSRQDKANTDRPTGGAGQWEGTGEPDTVDAHPHTPCTNIVSKSISLCFWLDLGRHPLTPIPTPTGQISLFVSTFLQYPAGPY